MISVIIPTRNRSCLLEKMLKSLLKQTLSVKEFEVVVIDNASSDNTKEVVRATSFQLPNLRYIYEPNLGLHAGRHRGFQEAQGDILVYGDDDIEALPTWLEIIKACFEKNVAMMGGKNLPKFEFPPPDWLRSMWQPDTAGHKILAYLSILDLGDQPKPISPNLIFGCNLAIRRSVLEAANGFHPDAMPQELIRYRGDGETYVAQYVQAKGYQAFYHPDASVYHWVSARRMTLEYFCLRAYNEGISDSFTQIRKTAGLPPFSTQSIAAEAIARVKADYRRVQQISIRPLKTLIHRTLKSKNCTPDCEVLPPPEFEKMQTQIKRAYQNGYQFHQQAVANDPQLLEWVLRPHYWEYQLPETLSLTHWTAF